MRELADTMTKWVSKTGTLTIRKVRFEGYWQIESDRTVHLTYQKDGRPVTLTMGKQARAADNLRVLYLAVEAMRMNDKRGLGEVIQDTYLQLAGPEKAIDPYELLGIRPDVTPEVAEAVYRTMASRSHYQCSAPAAARSQRRPRVTSWISQR